MTFLVTLVVLAGLAFAGSIAARSNDDGAGEQGPTSVVEVDLRAPSRQPAFPPAATEPTESGATAFVLFWFDTLNFSLATGNSDLLVSYTGAGCRQCTGYIIGIQRWKGSGAKLEGGLTVPLDLAIGPFSTQEPVQFAATYLTTPATVTQKDGSPSDFPGGRTRGGMTVLWTGDRWQMTDIVLDVKQEGSRP